LFNAPLAVSPRLRNRKHEGHQIGQFRGQRSISTGPLEEAYDGYVRIMFFTDAASGLVTPYFMLTFGTEKENLAALKDYVEYLEIHHGLEVKVVHSDDELFTKRTCN
jgi:hypothetical protein